MAKKKQPKGPDKKQIVEAFMEMARSHNIDKEKLHAIIWDTFATLVKKKYGSEVQFDIVVNLEKGDIEIYVIREIVEEVEDPTTQISLEEARLMDEEYEVGDEFVANDPFGAANFGIENSRSGTRTYLSGVPTAAQ